MNYILFILFICTGMAGAVLAKKLTIIAAITGGVLGTVIYFGVGWPGIALLGVFFLLGVLATSWGKNNKQSLGIAEENKGKRNAGQVLANGGAGGLLGLAAVFFPQNAALFLFLMGAAFSSATADTVSSELGTVYGKKCYDMLTFKKGKGGADGVISIEGTIFGLIGSCIIAAVYSWQQGWSEAFFWIVIAGTAGNLADSYLGATAERKGMIRNDAVNFLNTATAVLVGYLLVKI